MKKESTSERWKSLANDIKTSWPQVPLTELEQTGGDFRDIEKLIARYSKDSPAQIRKTLGEIFEKTLKTSRDDLSGPSS